MRLEHPRHPDQQDAGDEDGAAWAVGACSHGVVTDYVDLDGNPVCPRCFPFEVKSVGRVACLYFPYVPLQITLDVAKLGRW